MPTPHVAIAPAPRPLAGFRVKRPALDVRASTILALQGGGELRSPTEAEWNIAGRCERPVSIQQDGFGHHHGTGKETKWEPGRTLAMSVKCRQCPQCLRERRLLWGNRAVQEYRASSRTWFGTLTIAPENRYRFLALTRQRLDAQHCDLAGLTPRQQFAEVHKTTGPVVTEYIKSLRGSRKSALPFRFLLTVEPHKDWTPHYHMLVHEVTDLHPVRKAILDGRWKHGFSQWRLVLDNKAAFYAAKYLGKFSMARVQASKNYGEANQALSIGSQL